MKINIITIFFVLVFLIVSASSASHASWLFYHKPAFRGKIIDNETREAIEGAVVVAIYKKNPIISGPAGGSSTIIHIREVLSDKDGVFHIPAYTTIIQPLSLEGNVDFIIYKPGYGSYPGRPVYPLRYIGPEKLFSEEMGKQVEIQKRGKTVSVTFGIVELPRLKTKEERRKASLSPAGEKSDWKKQKELIRLIREEWKYIYSEDPEGLYHLEEE